MKSNNYKILWKSYLCSCKKTLSKSGIHIIFSCKKKLTDDKLPNIKRKIVVVPREKGCSNTFDDTI